jgi:hypothetical protein
MLHGTDSLGFEKSYIDYLKSTFFTFRVCIANYNATEDTLQKTLVLLNIDVLLKTTESPKQGKDFKNDIIFVIKYLFCLQFQSYP